MINESETLCYIHIYNKCYLLHTHSDDYMTTSKLNNNENVNADDDNEFENQKSVDIELYQFFITLVKHTCNKHAIECENSDDFDDKNINHNYN